VGREYSAHIRFGWVTIEGIQRKLDGSCKMTGEVRRFEKIRTAWIKF